MDWIRRHKPTGTVVCMASNPKNLHDKYGGHLGLSDDYEDIEANFAGRIGDLFKSGKVTPKPENYPQPSKAERKEKETRARIERRRLEADLELARKAKDKDAVKTLKAQLAEQG